MEGFWVSLEFIIYKKADNPPIEIRHRHRHSLKHFSTFQYSNIQTLHLLNNTLKIPTLPVLSNNTTTPRKVLSTPRDWDEWLLAARDYAMDHITTPFSICYMRQWIDTGWGTEPSNGYLASAIGLEFL